MNAPSVNAKTLPGTVTLPARRLAAAPVNCVGVELDEVSSTVGVASSEDVDNLEDVILEDVITLVDDGVTNGVDAGSKVAVEAGTEPSVGVSDCVGTASTIAAVTDSNTEFAATSSVAVNEKAV
jgi:hypothetical protein